LRVSRQGRIGVIGTKSTIASLAYEKHLKKLDPSCVIFSASCPLFVPLVENRHLNDEITYKVAEYYLKGLKKNNIDTLILGCTHYPLLKDVLSKVVKGVEFVDSPSAVVKEMKTVIHEKGLASGRRGRGKLKCYVSDDAEGFRVTAGIFLRNKINVSRAVL
jgi:glutamate racemase